MRRLHDDGTSGAARYGRQHGERHGARGQRGLGRAVDRDRRGSGLRGANADRDAGGGDATRTREGELVRLALVRRRGRRHGADRRGDREGRGIGRRGARRVRERDRALGDAVADDVRGVARERRAGDHGRAVDDARRHRGEAGATADRHEQLHVNGGQRRCQGGGVRELERSAAVGRRQGRHRAVRGGSNGERVEGNGRGAAVVLGHDRARQRATHLNVGVAKGGHARHGGGRRGGAGYHRQRQRRRGGTTDGQCEACRCGRRHGGGGVAERDAVVVRRAGEVADGANGRCHGEVRDAGLRGGAVGNLGRDGARGDGQSLERARGVARHRRLDRGLVHDGHLRWRAGDVGTGELSRGIHLRVEQQRVAGCRAEREGLAGVRGRHSRHRGAGGDRDGERRVRGVDRRGTVGVLHRDGARGGLQGGDLRGGGGARAGQRGRGGGRAVRDGDGDRGVDNTVRSFGLQLRVVRHERRGGGAEEAALDNDVLVRSTYLAGGHGELELGVEAVQEGLTSGDGRDSGVLAERRRVDGHQVEVAGVSSDVAAGVPGHDDTAHGLQRRDGRGAARNGRVLRGIRHDVHVRGAEGSAAEVQRKRRAAVRATNGHRGGGGVREGDRAAVVRRRQGTDGAGRRRHRQRVDGRAAARDATGGVRGRDGARRSLARAHVAVRHAGGCAAGDRRRDRGRAVLNSHGEVVRRQRRGAADVNARVLRHDDVVRARHTVAAGALAVLVGRGLELERNTVDGCHRAEAREVPVAARRNGRHAHAPRAHGLRNAVGVAQDTAASHCALAHGEVGGRGARRGLAADLSLERGLHLGVVDLERVREVGDLDAVGKHLEQVGVAVADRAGLGGHVEVVRRRRRAGAVHNVLGRERRAVARGAEGVHTSHGTDRHVGGLAGRQGSDLRIEVVREAGERAATLAGRDCAAHGGQAVGSAHGAGWDVGRRLVRGGHARPDAHGHHLDLAAGGDAGVARRRRARDETAEVGGVVTDRQGPALAAEARLDVRVRAEDLDLDAHEGRQVGCVNDERHGAVRAIGLSGGRTDKVREHAARGRGRRRRRGVVVRRVRGDGLRVGRHLHLERAGRVAAARRAGKAGGRRRAGLVLDLDRAVHTHGGDSPARRAAEDGQLVGARATGLDDQAGARQHGTVHGVLRDGHDAGHVRDVRGHRRHGDAGGGALRGAGAERQVEGVGSGHTSGGVNDRVRRGGRLECARAGLARLAVLDGRQRALEVLVGQHGGGARERRGHVRRGHDEGEVLEAVRRVVHITDTLEAVRGGAGAHPVLHDVVPSVALGVDHLRGALVLGDGLAVDARDARRQRDMDRARAGAHNAGDVLELHGEHGGVGQDRAGASARVEALGVDAGAVVHNRRGGSAATVHRVEVALLHDCPRARHVGADGVRRRDVADGGAEHTQERVLARGSARLANGHLHGQRVLGSVEVGDGGGNVRRHSEQAAAADGADDRVLVAAGVAGGDEPALGAEDVVERVEAKEDLPRQGEVGEQVQGAAEAGRRAAEEQRATAAHTPQREGEVREARAEVDAELADERVRELRHGVRRLRGDEHTAAAAGTGAHQQATQVVRAEVVRQADERANIHKGADGTDGADLLLHRGLEGVEVGVGLLEDDREGRAHLGKVLIARAQLELEHLRRERRVLHRDRGDIGAGEHVVAVVALHADGGQRRDGIGGVRRAGLDLLLGEDAEREGVAGVR
eukprot:PhM_4_TR16766/c0_g2_i1/m.75045